MESGGAGLIEIENCWETTGVGLVTLSATCTVKSAGFGPGPGPVGLPTIDPVEFNTNPSGRLPDFMLKVSGGTPPVTTIWKL
jgi:hypothetical protein